MTDLMTFDINDYKWQIKIVSEEEMKTVAKDVVDGEEEEDEDGRTAGLTDKFNLIIYIDPNMAPAVVHKTIIHELTHATTFSYGINYPFEEEELEGFMEGHAERIIAQTKVIEERLMANV